MFGSESDIETGCMYYVVRDIRNGIPHALTVTVTIAHSIYNIIII